MADEPRDHDRDEHEHRHDAKVEPISAELLEEGDDDDVSGREPPDLPRGSSVGRYSVLGRLAESESDIIYGAYDPDAQRKVALKMVRVVETDGDIDEAAARARMLGEAESLAALAHPCIATVHEVGTLDGWIYLVMEFLDGIDLRKWMEARDDPFPWREVLRVFREAGRGLVAAHKAGLVHRDFKPSSVLLCKGGRICVLDFGLGREEAPEQTDDIDVAELEHSFAGGVPTPSDRPASITRTGHTLGTPYYMAPEVHITHRSDARSDQFSFCVALYEALYGERPFAGNRPIALAMAAVQHKLRPAPAGSGVPGWLRAVVLRGLHPRPEERWPSMEALLRELARDPVASRRRWAVGGAVLVALTGGALGLARQIEAERRSCAPDEAALVDLWDPSRRATLQSAIASTDRAWADETWATLEDGIDRWTAEWIELSEAACVATRIRGDASEEIHALRVECLDRELGQIEALARLLERADPLTIDGAHGLVTGLVSPRVCTFTDDLTARPALSEELHDRVLVLQRELDDAEALRRAGRADQAAARAESLVAEIEPLHHAPLHADALLVLGRAQWARGELAAAEAALHDAATVAARAGLDRPLAEAFIDIASVLAAQERPEEALRFTRLADAIIEREQYDRLRSTLAQARGDVAFSARRPAEAITDYYRASELEGRRDDGHPLRRAPIWRKLGELLGERGDHATAARHFADALTILQNALGPRHPALADILDALAEAQYGAGELQSAKATLTRALEVREPVAPPVELGATLVRIAELEANIGNQDAARDRFARAQRMLETAGPEAAPALARSFVGLGQVLLDQGDAAAAIDPLRRAVTLREANASPDDLAVARFALARALWIEPSLHDTAIQLARDALVTFAGSGSSRGADLTAAQHWLHDHDPNASTLLPVLRPVPVPETAVKP